MPDVTARPYAPPRGMKAGGWALLWALLIAFPLVVTNPAWTTIGIFAVMYMLAVVGWNILSGYSGYISIGHAAYYGIGQYTVALIALHMKVPGGWDLFALLPVAGITAALAAIPIGWLLLRVQKHTFIVLTIAVMFILQLCAYNFSSFTMGSEGLTVPFPTWNPTTFNNPYYYVALFCATIAVLTSWWVRRSKYGLGLLAVREDEGRAKGLGIRVTRTKLIAYVISGFFVGVAGGIYASFVGSVYPQFGFDPLFDLSLAVMAFAGGLGTLAGPILGALVLESLQQYLQLQYGSTNVFLIVYGALFLIILRALPGGIVPGIADLWRRWWLHRHGFDQTAAPPRTGVPVGAAVATEAARGAS
jgi:branched-chain amino acid transport system permease protein